MALSSTAARFILALALSCLTACSSSASDADGGTDARPAADAADTAIDAIDAPDASDATSEADAPPVGCALGRPCSAEGATCTWSPPCGYPPSVACTCTKGVWSCSPACI